MYFYIVSNTNYVEFCFEKLKHRKLEIIIIQTLNHVKLDLSEIQLDNLNTLRLYPILNNPLFLELIGF